ncbi:MAG: hypothetical protein CMA05_04435 [Euryarchaeota archaeon]|nr:hypothetical protein [Euryarchaeota archaeon]
MSQMKRVVLPILEEIAAQPGSRMEIHTRVGESLNVEWGQFKRIIGHLKSTGLIDIDTEWGGRISVTPEGKEAISYD